MKPSNPDTRPFLFLLLLHKYDVGLGKMVSAMSAVTLSKNRNQILQRSFTYLEQYGAIPEAIAVLIFVTAVISMHQQHKFTDGDTYAVVSVAFFVCLTMIRYYPYMSPVLKFTSSKLTSLASRLPNSNLTSKMTSLTSKITSLTSKIPWTKLLLLLIPLVLLASAAWEEYKNTEEKPPGLLYSILYALAFLSVYVCGCLFLGGSNLQLDKSKWKRKIFADWKRIFAILFIVGIACLLVPLLHTAPTAADITCNVLSVLFLACAAVLLRPRIGPWFSNTTLSKNIRIGFSKTTRIVPWFSIMLFLFLIFSYAGVMNKKKDRPSEKDESKTAFLVFWVLFTIPTILYYM